MIRLVLTSLLVLFGFATACAASPPPLIITTFSVLDDMTRRIAGPDAAIKVLVGPTGEVHAYQPGPSDTRLLKQARIVIANGLGLEPWLTRLCDAADFRGERVFATVGMTPRMLSDRAGNMPDPHAWLDVSLARLYVRNITDALVRIDPERAAGYRARAADYDAELAQLDDRIRREIAAIAPERRRIATSHSAFGYFGAAYGVTFIGIADLSEDATLSAKSMRDLIDTIKQDHIKTLFVEHLTDPRPFARIAAETGAVPGGVLYSDSLAPPGQPGDSYLGLFDVNLPLLIGAMQDLR